MPKCLSIFGGVRVSVDDEIARARREAVADREQMAYVAVFFVVPAPPAGEGVRDPLHEERAVVVAAVVASASVDGGVEVPLNGREFGESPGFDVGEALLERCDDVPLFGEEMNRRPD